MDCFDHEQSTGVCGFCERDGLQAERDALVQRVAKLEEALGKLETELADIYSIENERTGGGWRAKQCLDIARTALNGSEKRCSACDEIGHNSGQCEPEGKP